MNTLTDIFQNQAFQNALFLAGGILAYLKLIQFLAKTEGPSDRPLTIEELEFLQKIIGEETERRLNEKRAA